MKIIINIGNRHVLVILLFIIAASAIGLVVAYGGTSPAVMGHSWEEMACDKCIDTPNLKDGSVTGTKLADNSITGSKIQDGTITGADIASNPEINGNLHVAGNAQIDGTIRGASWGFGGMYEYACTGNTGGCPCTSSGVRYANPITGTASCPAGFNIQEYWFFDGYNSNCLVLCYK